MITKIGTATVVSDNISTPSKFPWGSLGKLSLSTGVLGLGAYGTYKLLASKHKKNKSNYEDNSIDGISVDNLRNYLPPNYYTDVYYPALKEVVADE